MIELPHVLLVDDSSDDTELTCQGFKRSNHNVTISHVENGRLCLEYLRKTGDYQGASTPDLILLDLNMPVMDGREVLLALSKDPQLKRLPVVVLTTSDADTDVLFSYQMGCNSFIVKPVDFDDLLKTVNSICTYWFETSSLPPK
ncbi:Response regulator rcp1 [Rubripirellula tenax]|uniref:Response regulator rcp1 n=1 Tax=Rubripirellula tenax TaxID=2528015 RepID=A0A5C6E3X3_9BACT|nr:response regulator [Rubripirellula tenax]TWU43602.1 Response regulator rcp1 [Rubripirellula tenax]